MRVPYRRPLRALQRRRRRRAGGRVRLPRLVRHPRARHDAERPSRRRGLQRRLQRADARVRPTRHRPLSERRPDGDARDGRAAAATPGLPRRRRARPAALPGARLLPVAAPHPAPHLARSLDRGRSDRRHSQLVRDPLHRDAGTQRSTGSSRRTCGTRCTSTRSAISSPNPFPGFAGEAGRYPLDVVLPERQRQNRWITGFRFILAIPAFAVNAALGGALSIAAILTWFVALGTGSAPWGLRNLSAYALRYGAQLNAYLYLLTEQYPHASPLEGADEPQQTFDEQREHAPRGERGPHGRARGGLGRRRRPALALECAGAPPPAPRPARVLLRAGSCTTPASYSRGARWLWVLTTIAQLAALAVFARFGVRWARESAAGPDGHRDAARDARLRARVGGAAAVRGARGLVGAPLRTRAR